MLSAEYWLLNSDYVTIEMAIALNGGTQWQVKITVRRNGPYRVEAPDGAIELVDADGNHTT